MSDLLNWLIGAVAFVFQVAGIWFAIKAILISRTPQAAIGWSLALVIFPYVGIPLFLIFGESRFAGYVLAGSGICPKLDEARRRTQDALLPFATVLPDKYTDAGNLALNLRGLPATRGNTCRLLVDGVMAFPAMFGAIDSASDYVIVQFYIINDDEVGRELKARLLAARKRGVRCWVLYDRVGSKRMTDEYLQDLRGAGVAVKAFVTNRQFGRHFQMNFRNHRKLVLADGRTAFIGGLNAGKEYIGKGPLGPWRDTHMQISGPAVQSLQLSFLEDWYYASGEVPDLPIQPCVAGEQTVLPFASGPADVWSITPAVYCEIIHDVKKRLWIASPYLVPDHSLRSALAHAALRGVDVRIILPLGIDHLFPWLSSYTYYPALGAAGVKIWRYQPGFMHQKVLLADDDLAIVGSVNLDYRSFMLNFELAAAVRDSSFARDVETMFEADFTRSKQEDLRKFENGSFWFRFKCRLAALMSPEQ